MFGRVMKFFTYFFGRDGPRDKTSGHELRLPYTFRGVSRPSDVAHPV